MFVLAIGLFYTMPQMNLLGEKWDVGRCDVGC
jgi:hypothetical protein